MDLLFRAIPSISDVLSHPKAAELSRQMPRWAVRNAARELIAEERAALRAPGSATGSSIIPKDACLDEARQALLEHVIARLPAAAARCAAPGPQEVINATGVVLHTNLGRAPLPEYAASAAAQASMGYSDLEFDLDTGGRGSRQSHIAATMAKITSAPASYVVNNNAAAVLLCLDTLAKGKQVLVSRGELVEIGGAFRVPDIMERSGASLVEVGTTNRTRISDYRKALGPEVGLLLKVHTSNFRIVGFTEETSVEELVHLGRECGVPVMYDLGSGLMPDLSQYGLGSEPTVAHAVSAGADLVTFSGDKLFGGPQAGIIVGSSDLILSISKNPLARALRIDKLTLSALAAVAAAWEDPDEAVRTIPVAHMLTVDCDTLRERACRLLASIQGKIGVDGPGGAASASEIEIVDDPSEAGGGSMPTVSIPGVSISIRSCKIAPNELQRRLRIGNPPIVARVADGSVRLHMRTLFERDFERIATAVVQALSGGEA